MLGNSLVLMLFQDSHTVCTEDGKFWTSVGPRGVRKDKESPQETKDDTGHFRRQAQMHKETPQPRLSKWLLTQFQWIFQWQYYIKELANCLTANNLNYKLFISHHTGFLILQVKETTENKIQSEVKLSPVRLRSPLNICHPFYD